MTTNDPSRHLPASESSVETNRISEGGRVRRRLIGATAAAGAVAALPRFAIGQGAWPSKPIRIIVNFPPGGLTDNIGRQYGEFIGSKVGATVVVENRPGAGGLIGADVVAKAPADGHTLLMSISTSLWHGRVLYSRMPYHPDKDFAPITLFPSGALLMGVNAKLPIRNAKEMLAYAQKNPTNMGTYSPASWPHLIADTWNGSEGTKITPIHYKGESPMWPDVASGIVQTAVGSHQAMNAHIQRGTIRAIAALGAQRSPRLPDLSTFAEQGFKHPVFTLDGWLPFCAPAGTPEEILVKINDAIVEGYRTSPKIKQMHESFGIPTGPTGLAETRERWAKESPIWIAMAHRLGIKLD
jgi:tripartite-type tricarboxylate transporter receptor subunit TctC